MNTLLPCAYSFSCKQKLPRLHFAIIFCITTASKLNSLIFESAHEWCSRVTSKAHYFICYVFFLNYKTFVHILIVPSGYYHNNIIALVFFWTWCKITIQEKLATKPTTIYCTGITRLKWYKITKQLVINKGLNGENSYNVGCDYFTYSTTLLRVKH